MNALSPKPRRAAWGLAVLVLVSVALLLVPPVRQRVAWHVTQWRSQLYYALHPPEEAVFVPQRAAHARPSPTPPAVHTPLPSPTPPPTPTAIVTPTPRPAAAFWPPPQHEYQDWNNCAPATLSMALAFWGWEGDQYTLAAWLKPNPRDKNVMPEEIEAAVLRHTRFMALMRPAGDLDLLRSLIAAGFPVVVEKGFEPNADDGWMGHYLLVWGYDDAKATFYAHDSYQGPEQAITYDQLQREWRAFNFIYLVVYPPERDGEVRRLLGQWADPTAAWQAAAQRAAAETRSLSGRDAVFAWFNLGESLVALGDEAAAAQAFDQAFTLLAALPPDIRPWRWMWYHQGPYQAYDAVGRYDDVIQLATTTLKAMSEPVLEEAYYWRGRAYAAQGNYDAARADFQRALEAHPGYPPAQAALEALEATDTP